MTRRMSCALTAQQVRDQIKTETRRRLGTWRNLHAGDRLTLIEKGMGLAKGEHQVVLADVEITHVADVPLAPMTWRDIIAEGLWDQAAHPMRTGEGYELAAGGKRIMSPCEWFYRFWLTSHGYPEGTDPTTVFVRLIRWRYL